MIRSGSILLAASVAALFAAACSSGGVDTLGGEEPFGPRTTSPPAKTEDPAATPPAKTPGSTTPATETPAGTPPVTGPGSTGSAAHKFYVETVHAKLASCGACHASGAQGAPKFLQTVPDEAYLAMDARGLIKADTLLLTKGAHAAGAAPVLTSEQRTAVDSWLAKEAVERVGKAAPTNLLQVAATCGDPAKFPTAALTTWLTTRRQNPNENGNQCTGCNNTQCASCHFEGEANVNISSGRLTDNQRMIDFYKSPESISRFIGISGTTLVASNAFKIKSEATVADVRPINVPKHPQYLMTPQKQAAIDAYVQDIITKFNAGTCPKPVP